MPQRMRASPAGRSNAPAVVAVVLFVAILILTGRWLSGEGGGRRPPTSSARTGTASAQAPSRIGAKTQCPPRWPVLAMSDRTSYPPGHPGKSPPGVTAVACYQTAAQAASAGYPPAPLPAGVLEVGGVYLAPTSSSFRARCRQVADRLGFAVPCPGLLPTLVPGVRPPRLCEEPLTCRRGLALRFQWDGFQVPLGYLGPSDYGTLDIVAGPTGGAADRLARQCLDERRVAAHHAPDPGGAGDLRRGRPAVQLGRHGAAALVPARHPDGGRRLRLERGQPATGRRGGQPPTACRPLNLIPRPPGSRSVAPGRSRLTVEATATRWLAASSGRPPPAARPKACPGRPGPGVAC